MLATETAAAPADALGCDQLMALGRAARAAGDHAAARAHFLAAADAAPQNPWPQVEAAASARALGQPAEAARGYEQVLIDHPRQVQAMLGLGQLAREEGDHAAALRHFDAAAATAPEMPWPLIEQATTLRTLGRLDAAEAAFTDVLVRHPGQVQALLGLGQVARDRQALDAALDHFATAAAAAPGNPWPAIETAETLRRLGRLAEAEAAYAAVLAAHPAQVQALLGLGHVARDRRDLAQALEHFATAMATAGPGNPWPRLEHAATLALLGRPDAAAADYAAVLADHPGQPQALLGLGRLARQRGDRATARRHFQDAMAAAPQIAGARLEFATELRDGGDVDGAAAIARRMLAADASDVGAWLSLGLTERAAGRRAEALAAFTAAQDRRPSLPDPLIDMAIEHRALGRPEVAREHLLRALAIDPANLRALELLGEAARQAGHTEEALDRFQAAIAARPASIWAWLGLARSLADAGRPDAAMDCLAEAEQATGPSPDAAAQRLELLRRRGHWPDALAAARAATDAWPRHFALWQQRLLLERLLATPQEVAICLAAAPPVTAAERARRHHLDGLTAEEEWRHGAAIAAYERALALAPDDAWTLSDLARARILDLDLGRAGADLGRLARLTTTDALVQGRAPRASQTHLGQILAEFTIDTEVMAQLQALRPLPAAARLAPLAALLRRVPDHTPAAMLYLIALRQTGAFAAAPAPGARPGIPRRLHQYWNRPEPPAEVAALMDGWAAAHPGWDVQRLDDAAAEAFLDAQATPAALAAFRRAREPAQKADLFRLACLFAEGGWYVDADDRCAAPLDALAARPVGLVLYQEEYGTIGNNIIGAAPQHPVIGLALDWAVTAIARGDCDLLWLSTGPGLMTRALAHALLHGPLSEPAWLRRIAVLSRREMHQHVAMHCQISYKSTALHWSRTAFGQRRTRTAEAMVAG